MPVNINFDQAYPSRWLKAGDLETDRATVVTVKDINFEPIGQDKTMTLVLNFTEFPDKGFILNKTNASTLKALFGADPNAAIGKKIALYVTEVAFSGKMVDAIRISTKIPGVKQPQPQQPPMPEPPDDDLMPEFVESF